MKLVTALTFLGLASMVCAYSDSRVDSIVDDVTAGNYANALLTTFTLATTNRQDLVQEAVDALFENGERNLFDYGYRLMNAPLGNGIFTKTFPIEIQRVLNGDRVKIVNKNDNLPMKLGSRPDKAGDRIAYGDSSDPVSTIIAWEFETISNDSLTFHILNVKYDQYLKLGVQVDRFGDHTAYGAGTPKNDRFQWFLVPAKYDGDNLFYIVNIEFNQALKFDRKVDSDGDRKAFGNNGGYDDPIFLGFYLPEY